MATAAKRRTPAKKATPNSMAKRVEALEEQVACLSWLHAELMYGIKVAAIKKHLQANQDAMAAALASGQGFGSASVDYKPELFSPRQGPAQTQSTGNTPRQSPAKRPATVRRKSS